MNEKVNEMVAKRCYTCLCVGYIIFLKKDGDRDIYLCTNCRVEIVPIKRA